MGVAVRSTKGEVGMVAMGSAMGRILMVRFIHDQIRLLVAGYDGRAQEQRFIFPLPNRRVNLF